MLGAAGQKDGCSRAPATIRQPGNQPKDSLISPQVIGQIGRYEAWLGHWKPEYDRMVVGGNIEELMMQVREDLVI